ncbi:MAG TPA: hypothetical protein VMH82_02140 [Myxococcota bacterium]|nr:hypothetical protein [Myxococcota bacterium]
MSRDAEVADAPRSRPPPGRPARNHRARAQGRAGGYTNALSTDPNLISIDPDGNQFIVGMNSSSPGLLVDGARGIAVSPIAGHKFVVRAFYVAAFHGLWRVDQTISVIFHDFEISASATSLGAQPAPYDTGSEVGNFATIRDEGDGTLDLLVAPENAVLYYNGGLGTFVDTPLISGFGVTRCAYSQDAGLVVLSGSPSQGQAGVFYSGTEIDSTPVPIAVGGDVAAPGPPVVALPGEGSPAPFPVYLVAGSKVVRVDSDGTTSVAATLPFSLTAYFGITAYAPEPDATPVAAAVTLGWIAIRSRLRRRR